MNTDDIVFSDAIIKQHIELSSIPEEEKQELIDAIPSMDQVMRARLVINLQMQRVVQETREQEQIYDSSTSDEQVEQDLKEFESKKKAEYHRNAAQLKSTRILDKIHNPSSDSQD